MSEIRDYLEDQLARKSAVAGVEKLSEDLKEDWGMNFESSQVKEQSASAAEFVKTKSKKYLKLKSKLMSLSPERKKQILADINKKYGKKKRR